ncbi:MAG TPA: D-glycerate dehydrogenase [Acidimicrobiales bacterium]|nr:D-glycerate dehydrogenase [Acidimicrobiales bacterium]
MATVLVTRHLPNGALDPLADHVVRIRNDDVPYGHSELVEAVADVDAVVCVLTDRIDAEVLSAASRLRVIGNIAVGIDNIDTTAARAAGVQVINTPGVLDETTADLAFALILAASRGTSGAERDLRAGSWRGWSLLDHVGRDVYGATLGLVGYGRIAHAVARRAVGFDMTVLHWSRRSTGEPGYVRDLDDLLVRSDIVSLHVPLTESTRHLIGARELDLLGPKSVIVNTARGAVIDEAALAVALEGGRIFAAGLDVYSDEPRVAPALLHAPRTVLLPHMGSASLATRRRMALVATSGVAAALAKA